MSRIGLVLGGGGVTGAAFQYGALLALESATGWNPAMADVVVGTSSGATVAAVTRSGISGISALIADAMGEADFAKTLRRELYTRAMPSGLVRWVRHGLVPGSKRPGMSLILGSPAAYSTRGLERWVSYRVGPVADSWPSLPTLIVAYQLEGRRRVVFGTDASPDVTLKRAVAASSAVPVIYAPVEIDGRHYVDGGIASGTSADLVLGADTPVDLVIVIAPMASDSERPGARFYEGSLDEVGRLALDAELGHVAVAWPDTEVLVLKPDMELLQALRSNPMSTRAVVPAFLQTVRSLESHLSEPDTRSILERHLAAPGGVPRITAS